jgi:hypothetical protein
MLFLPVPLMLGGDHIHRFGRGEQQVQSAAIMPWITRQGIGGMTPFFKEGAKRGAAGFNPGKSAYGLAGTARMMDEFS